MILPVLLLLAFQGPMLENEFVMVHLATDQPHKKGAPHKHDMDRVMIYLDDARQHFERQNGAAEDRHWKAGQVDWSPATGLHTSENVGDAPFRIIEIELKPMPAIKDFKISPLDPVRVDPKRFHLEFENDKVRVFRGKYGPNEEGAMHEHLHNRLVAYLTSGELRVTTPDGKTEVKNLVANTVSWGGPAKHSESIGDAPIEMVVVELKSR